jgi:hypothetical protein
MAMTKDYDPRRDGPKRPRPPMPSKPSAGNKPRPPMPQIIDDMPLPTIPGTNEPDYPIYLPPMPGKPMPRPTMPSKPGAGRKPGPFMPRLDPSMPGANSQEQLKNAARGAAIMKRMS